MEREGSEVESIGEGGEGMSGRRSGEKGRRRERKGRVVLGEEGVEGGGR